MLKVLIIPPHRGCSLSYLPPSIPFGIIHLNDLLFLELFTVHRKLFTVVRSPALDHRADLLEAALKLFADHGYDAVGVQSIVEAAGVTKPTLYHYFGSKQGLFETLIQEKSAGLLAVVTRASRYQGNITGSIKEVVRSYFEYAAAEPAFYRMVLSMWFAPPGSENSASVLGLLERQTASLEEMFRLAAGDHGNMRGRARQYAISLKGLIDTYIGVWLQSGLDLAHGDIQARIVHQFMHGIFS
jgi:AcrR family transcriptional regulator